MGFSQLDDGSIAPDWEVDDIFGNTHHLYDYLDSGYTVYINICATWCPPCYTYHELAHFDSLWHYYGPEGTNEIRVFHIEGDPQTNIEDLYGTGSNTYGDYVTGVEYPIIDSDSIAALYEISYYPTIYMICPDRIISEPGQLNFTELYERKDSCYIPSDEEIFRIYDIEGPKRYCAGQSTDLSVQLINYDSTSLQNLRFDVLNGQELLSTTYWNGNLDLYAIETVPLNNFQVNQNMHILVVASDATSTYVDSIELDINLVNIGSYSFTIKLYTDYWPSETSWELQDSNKEIIESHSFESQPGGGENALTMHTYNISLPNTQDCYDLVIRDNYGDGFDISYGQNPAGKFGFLLENESGIIADFTTTDSWLFGDSIRLRAFETNQASAVNKEEFNRFKVYPNPTEGSLYFENPTNQKPIHCAVYNSQGIQVRRMTTEQINKTDILKGLKPGTYVLQILFEGGFTHRSKVTVY